MPTVRRFVKKLLHDEMGKAGGIVKVQKYDRPRKLAPLFPSPTIAKRSSLISKLLNFQGLNRRFMAKDLGTREIGKDIITGSEKAERV
jgi:hypothetical protein